MANLNTSFNSILLLEKTIDNWKRNLQQSDIKKSCMFSTIPKTTGDFQINLSISGKVLINGIYKSISFNAAPFITTTLGSPQLNSDIVGENKKLIDLLQALDKKFTDLMI